MDSPNYPSRLVDSQSYLSSRLVDSRSYLSSFVKVLKLFVTNNQSMI